MSEVLPQTVDEARSERILRAAERTLNHDLPNLVIALKGMVQLLKCEESERLSPAGQDYLSRVAGITQRLQSSATILRALNKTGLEPATSERIALADALKETAAAVRSGLAGRNLHFHAELRYPAVTAPRLPLQQALGELLLLLGEVSDSRDLHFYIVSQFRDGEIELMLGNNPIAPEVGGATADGEKNFPPEPEAGSAAATDFSLAGPEQRLRLLLIEEVARAWAGTVRAGSMSGKGFLFTLSFPDENVLVQGPMRPDDL